MNDTRVREEGSRLADDVDPITTFAAGVLDVLVDRSRRTLSTLRHDLVVALAQGMVRQDDTRIEATMREFRRACISPGAMAEVYVPAAARLLGGQWVSDTMSFAEVTIATARLQALVRAIGTRWGGDMTHIPSRRTVLMLVPEGETHTLGAVVATGQLRRMGFSVCLRLGPSLQDVRTLLHSRVFDAAMISVGTGDRLEGSVKLVNTLRALGPRRMPVLAGGSSLRDPADLKEVTGVDFVTSDLSEAMRLCAFDVNYPTSDSAILQTHARQTA